MAKRGGGSAAFRVRAIWRAQSGKGRNETHGKNSTFFFVQIKMSQHLHQKGGNDPPKSSAQQPFDPRPDGQNLQEKELTMYLQTSFDPSIATPAEEADLRDLMQNQASAFLHSCELLAGKPGAKLVWDVLDALTRTPKLTRRLQTHLAQMLEILSLEHVHDTNRPEAGYFARINPADPAIEEICLLTDRLRYALQKAGVSLPSDCNEANRLAAPDPEKIIRLLSTVVAALAAERSSFLEQRSLLHKRCMLAENAWYGARLTDRLHLIRLRHAAAGRIAA